MGPDYIIGYWGEVLIVAVAALHSWLAAPRLVPFAIANRAVAYPLAFLAPPLIGKHVFSSTKQEAKKLDLLR